MEYEYGFEKIVAKPILKCTANCLGCTSRRDHHRLVARGRLMSLEQWKTVMREAVPLGLKVFAISGGEPTLYKHLLELIREAKGLGLEVRMNTNGSLITEKLAEDLLAAGLDWVNVSLYSHDPEVHNAFRRSKNIWQKATRGIQIFAELAKKKYPDFRLIASCILLRENYRDFDKLIKLHHDLGAHFSVISYLEGDFEKKYLLKEEEIREFIDRVRPKLVRLCRTFDPEVSAKAVRIVEGLYGEQIGPISDLAQGIYWKPNCCTKPLTMAVILAGGQVNPCILSEYTGEPVVGNLFEQSLTEIWYGEKWNELRKNLHEKCPLCPMNIHVTVPLRYIPPADKRGLMHSVYRSRWFRPFRPAAKGVLDLYRSLFAHQR